MNKNQWDFGIARWTLIKYSSDSYEDERPREASSMKYIRQCHYSYFKRSASIFNVYLGP